MNNVLNNFRSFFLMTKRHKISESFTVAHFDNLKMISNYFCKVTVKRSPAQDRIACWTTIVLYFFSGNHLKCTSLKNKIIHIWKYFPRYWPYLCGKFTGHKGQWRGAVMFSLFCPWINGWVKIREAGDLRRHCAHHGVIVMFFFSYDLNL